MPLVTILHRVCRTPRLSVPAPTGRPPRKSGIRPSWRWSRRAGAAHANLTHREHPDPRHTEHHRGRHAAAIATVHSHRGRLGSTCLVAAPEAPALTTREPPPLGASPIHLIPLMHVVHPLTPQGRRHRRPEDRTEPGHQPPQTRGRRCSDFGHHGPGRDARDQHLREASERDEGE